MDKIQSKTIDLLRFPLAVLVVLIHTNPSVPLTAVIDMKYPILFGTWCYNIIEMTLSNVISKIAVPTFFVFSGYLFFQKLSTWNWSIYRTKMQKRIFSLLIPYLLWNMFAILALTLPPSFKVLTETGSWESMWHTFIHNDYTSLKSFWNCNWWNNPVDMWGVRSTFTTPLIIPLWFIRDLLITTTCAPLIYLYFSRTMHWGIIIITTCYLLHLWPNISGLPVTATYYFSIGAFMAIKKNSLVSFATRTKWLSSILTFTCGITIMMFYGKTYIGGIPASIIHDIFVLSGIRLAIYISSNIISCFDLKTNKSIIQSCFFIYAFHTFPFSTTQTQYTILGLVYIKVNNALSGTAHTDLLRYLLPPFITICICLLFLFVLKNISNRMASLLTGNRNN